MSDSRAQIALLAIVVMLGWERADQAAARPAALSSCVLLVRADSSRYYLSYPGRSCPQPGYKALPVDQFDSVASWAFNAHSAGVLSALDKFRIDARLAGLDRRSEHGFNLHEFRPWAEHKWALHTETAYLTALDVIGRKPPVLTSLEQPLLQRQFGSQGALYVELKHRGLSSREREELIHILSAAEDSLADLPPMTATKLTLDEAARAARPGHEAESRRTFSKYRLN